MSRSYVWHDSFVCVWHGSFIRVTRLICMCVTWLIYVVTRLIYLCVTWLIHTCDMTHVCLCDMARLCVTRLLYLCETWLIRMCDTNSSFVCEMRYQCMIATATHCNTLQHTATHCNTAIQMGDSTRFCVKCVTGLSHVCDMTDAYVTWRIQTCNMSHPYVWRDSCSVWSAKDHRQRRWRHSHMWHHSFVCVTWLIHMCDTTHSYV